MPSGRIPGPIGLTVASGAVAAASASVGAAAPAGRSREQFKQAVLDGQIRRKEKQGKTYLPAPPKDQLEVVEDGHRMRKEAAKSCRDLLSAARAALESAKKNNDVLATRVSAIGIASAYRDYDEDKVAWSNTFEKHYEKPANKSKMEAMPGGRHGDAALQWFIDLMAPIKAPPGFSNHSDGKAVDFSITEGGKTYGADTDKRETWRANWFHPWLVANAKTYRFHPLASEEWHWDWK